MKIIYFLAFFLLAGCAPKSQTFVSYRMPDYVDVKDKNECYLAARNNKIGERAYENSRSGKSTTLDAKDFTMITLAAAVAASGSYAVITIVIPSSSNPIKDADLAERKYLETCLSKKGYKFDP